MTAKGFDTTTAQNDYDLLLELAINADVDGPVLDAGRSVSDGLITGDALYIAGPTRCSRPTRSHWPDRSHRPHRSHRPERHRIRHHRPGPADGATDQFYLNTTAGTWFGPKRSDGTWPLVETLGYWG